MGLLDKLIRGRIKRSGKPRESLEDFAYAIWSCLCDSDSCDECRALDGIYFLPRLANMPQPPLPSCKSSKGCRCILIYIPKESPGAVDTAEFIRKQGGKATSEQVAEYRETKQAPAREENLKRRLASDKAQAARRHEKDHPEESIALYRESIAIQRELAQNSPDQWSWRDFPYLYNRLTLLLERLKRYEEALEEIKAYEALPHKDAGTKSDREVIEKRKIRLKRKL
mgnify:CR=1 FL=1